MKRKNRGLAPLEKTSLINKKRSSLTGFTLIEIIMAVTILAIVGSAVSVFVINHLVAVSNRNQYSLSLNLARLEIEKVQNLNYSTASFDSNIVSLNTSNYLGYGLYVARTVTTVASSGAEAIKQIQVDVKKNASSPSIITMSTYITRGITFGL